MMEFKKFAGEVFESAVHDFPELKEYMPQWHLLHEDGKIGVIVSPWSNNDEKDIITQGMKSKMRDESVIMYCLVVETWMAKAKDREDAVTGPRPSERADKQEGLVLIGESAFGETVLATSIITRVDGKIVMGKIDWVWDAKKPIEGMFAKMLDPRTRQ